MVQCNGGARMLSSRGLRSESSYQPLPTHAVPTAKQIHKDHFLTAGHLVLSSRRGRVRLCWLAPQQFENLIRTTANQGFSLTAPTPGIFESLRAKATNLTAATTSTATDIASKAARRRRLCCHAVTSPNYAVVECEEVRCRAVSERFGDVSHTARASVVVIYLRTMSDNSRR